MVAQLVATPLTRDTYRIEITRTEILTRIPHGESRLRVDRVEVLRPQDSWLAIGHLLASDTMCHDHFDASKGFEQIMAGIDLEEMAAQTGTVMTTVISKKFLGHAALFTGPRTFDSQHMVPRGLEVTIHVWLESSIEELIDSAKGKARCQAQVGRETVMTGQFGFVLVNKERYNRLVAIERKQLLRACRSNS